MEQADEPEVAQPAPLAQAMVASGGLQSPMAAASTMASITTSQRGGGGGGSQIRTVNPGDRVNIPCSLANMGGSIQFAKDDQPIILDSGCAHCQLDISNDGQASLTINRVSQRDQGHWQCWRLDSQGKVKQKIPIIQLVVTNSPELPILIVNDKELLGGNNLDATITIKENELVSFKCLIKGAATPVDYVHWMLDSNTNVTEMSQLMMEYSAQESNYLTQSVLKLNATKSMNLKSISCLSNHQLWITPMTVTALLNVLYDPSFTISREPGFGVPVSEGMTVILKCEIDSNPSSSPVWIKDADNKTADATNQQQQQQQQLVNSKDAAQGEPIVLETQDDGSVIFQPARRQDSGWYRCKTENKYGNFSSFGYYLNVRPAATSSQAAAAAAATAVAHQAAVTPNSFPQHLNAHQRPRSDSRIMGPNQPAAQLSAAAAPFQSLAQHRQQQQQQQAAQSQPQTVDPMQALQRSQLANDQPAIQVTTPQDDAMSRCPKQQRIDGFPEIKNPITTVQAVLGRQLILPLRFCCNPGPARVFWIHRHLAMIPGRMFGPYITRDVYSAYNSFFCYETTFEIEAVKPEDIGTVYVFVSNERGHAGAQIHIQLAKTAAESQFGNMLGIGSSRFALPGSNGNHLAGLAGSAGARSQPSSLPTLIIVALAVAFTTSMLATCNSHRLQPNAATTNEQQQQRRHYCDHQEPHPNQSHGRRAQNHNHLSQNNSLYAPELIRPTLTENSPSASLCSRSRGRDGGEKIDVR